MALSPKLVRQLYVWHKWTGLITGIFLFVICLSGAVLMFKPQIDRAVTPAKRADSNEPHVPLDRVVSNVERDFSGIRINNIELPDGMTQVYTVLATQNRRRLEVFVDPASGNVTGSRSGENLTNVLRQLHLRFYFFGFWGRVVVGVFGAILLFSSISGLLIYGRFMRGVFSRGLHFWSLRPGLQLSTSDLHKFVGIAALAFNLIIAFSGTVLGLENLTRYAPTVARALQHRPQIRKRTITPVALRERPFASLEDLLEASQAAMPGFHPQSVALAGGGAGTILISGKTSGLASDGRSYIVFDTATGHIVEQFRQTEGTPANKFHEWVELLHYGAFGGLTLRVIYFLFGVTGSLLSVTGFMLWYFKTRRQRMGYVAS